MAEERLIPGTRHWRAHGVQHLQRYRFLIPYVKGKRVADLACGVGYGSYVLASTGAESVTGIDLSDEAVGYAREHYQRHNLRYEQGNAELWEGGGSFGAVVSLETIEHLPHPADFLRNVHRHLEPGGVLAISAPNALTNGRLPGARPNPYHLNEPDYATFRSWLEPWFEVEEEWEQAHALKGALDGQADYYDLLSQSVLVRGLLRLEEKVRRILPGVRRFQRINLEPLLCADTVILPLLPERRPSAKIFLFICRRKD
jgi:SAM-dependent methyltransferase